MLYPHVYHVSRDKIRFEIVKENEAYFSKEKEVFPKFINEICNVLKAGLDVVADATHINPVSRTKLLRAICENLPNEFRFRTIYLYFTTSLEDCLDRNELRTGREYVPESAIRDMWKNLIRPTIDEIPWTGYILDIHGR